MGKAVLRTQIQNALGARFGINLSIREKTAPEVLPTGIANIDIPRGTLTEICGQPSSGRSSILNGALARATRQPEFCALIDAGNSFDPLSARNAGVQLPHLLWVRCGGSAEKALKATDLIIQAGGFGVVALDLAGVTPRDARRISLASWFRLRHAVEKTPTALILIGVERYAASCSTLQIESRSTGFQITDDLLQCLAVGPTNPVVTSGKAFSGSAPTTNTVQFIINGTVVLPFYSGLTGAGLYQFNLVLPADLGTGDVALQAIVAGVRSPAGVVISLQ